MPKPGRRLALILLLALDVACASTRCRPEAADPEKALLDVEHQWVDALARKDRGFLERLLADDFLDNAYNGKIYTRKEILERLAGGGPTFPSLGFEETRVRVYGEVGIFTGINVVRTDGGPVRVRFTDVFRRNGCAWQAVSAQETVVPAETKP